MIWSENGILAATFSMETVSVIWMLYSILSPARGQVVYRKLVDRVKHEIKRVKEIELDLEENQPMKRLAGLLVSHLPL
jgi:hypothetical protein